MGSTGDKDEETGAGVGGDESSQEMDSYGIDRPEDSLKNQLEVLIGDRELIMVAIKDFVMELKDISEIDGGIDEQIESRIMELKLIVEPMLMDIKSVSKDIQEIMKKLNFKSELVREYTTSRSYDAKIGMLLNKCSKKKQNDSSRQAAGKPTTTNSFFSMNSPHEGRFGNEQGHSQYPVGGFERQYSMYQPLGQPFNPYMQNYFPQPPWQPQYSPSMGRRNTGENLSSKLRLPKLELKSFDGNMMNWMEFWDSFERNIHLNSSLCDVDKMSYLKASLKGTACHAIADLRTTGDNYAPAVDILKEKYGKANVLKGSHMSALKAVVAVTYSKNLDGLKKLYELVDMHVKALSVLGTSEEQYSLVIVPDLMKKIPRDVELSIRRTMSVDHEWTMSEFLNKLREELLFRGMDEATPRVQNSREERNPNKGKAFAISPNATCAFCLGEHSSADCSVVTEVKKRKSILMRYKRCFCCLKKGHRVKDCYNKKPCSKCNEGEHHPVICEKEESVPNMHVVTPGGIAYQTVLAKVNVKGKPSIICRCLLDTGCDKTYMLQKTANLLKSKPLRQERKVLDTVHGERQHICSVYKIEVKDMTEKLKFETEVSTLSKLTSVKNVKPQILKKKFNHLKNLEFSDISSERELEIDVIIGLEDLCKLKTGNMKWGNAGDPVAEETTLGWTLMGPTNSAEDQSCSSSLLLTTDKENLSNQIAKLWDLETVGIREENSVEEKFEDTVTFNGERYSVQLPWKSDRWKTNHVEVRKHIEEKSDQKDSTTVTYAKESLGTKDSQSKILGLKWNPEEDTLGISMEAVLDVKNGKVTKREVLSRLSKVYDPLGIVGPVAVTAKLIFQDICKENKDWDESVSPEIEMRWKKWMQAVSRLTELKIPRCIMPAIGGPRKISIHVFGDASKAAYCTAVYLVWHKENQSGAHLVTAKTRLPPIRKEMTIPRLELTAARIAARLLKTVRETLKNWELEELVLWSDSSTVLHWLENRGQYRQFVQRRVDEIQALTTDVNLKYVPTAENPADLGTRGLSPQQLEQSKLWWNGPEFIVDGNYPHQPHLIETVESKAEERQCTLPIAEEEPSLSINNLVPAENYGSYGKLLRVTALVLSIDERRKTGVVFAIKDKLMKKLDSTPEGLSDRLMRLKLPLGKKRYATLISAYAPTMTNPGEINKKFYEELEALISTVPQSDKLILLGDFNARVGRDHLVWEGVIGHHGVGKCNSNGLLLLRTCATYGLAITNTMFRLPTRNKTS
eukprot:gene4207-20394_t